MTAAKYNPDSSSRFHRIWRDMKTRCLNPNRRDYKNYGGRGITVCEEWMQYENFVLDMYSSYQQDLQLERIDNNKGYSKDNCKWITKLEQANNKRTNRFITYQGITKTLSQWARHLHIPITTLTTRFYTYKWTIEKCFTYEGRIV